MKTKILEIRRKINDKFGFFSPKSIINQIQFPINDVSITDKYYNQVNGDYG